MMCWCCFLQHFFTLSSFYFLFSSISYSFSCSTSSSRFFSTSSTKLSHTNFLGSAYISLIIDYATWNMFMFWKSPSTKSTLVYNFILASLTHVISYLPPWIMLRLRRAMHAITISRTCCKATSFLPNNILHLPFNMQIARSIDIRMFDWMKFKCARSCDSLSFSPLDGE